MSYGSCPVAEVVGDQPASRRAPLWQSVVLVSGLALVLTTCCVAVSGGLTGWGAGVGAVLLQGPERSQQRIQQLEEIQTSVRADLVHPYGSMFPANPKFINPSGQPSQAVNPSPRYPYHNGQRMKSVLNDDFEHAPFGNHLPWEHMPEGALAKYDKRPDK